MITFRDPPPLEVRVRSMKEPVVAPPTVQAPLVTLAIALMVLIVGGIVVSSQPNDRSAKESLVAAFANSLPREVEHGVLALIPIGTSMRKLRSQVDELHVHCVNTTNSTIGDTLLTCLGTPTVWGNSFSQLSIRFASTHGALTSVSACPALVHWKMRPVPLPTMPRLSTQSARTCWRDETNVADNEWTYATVPDRAFTVVRVHGSDTVSRQAASTKDTLFVNW